MVCFLRKLCTLMASFLLLTAHSASSSRYRFTSRSISFNLFSSSASSSLFSCALLSFWKLHCSKLSVSSRIFWTSFSLNLFLFGVGLLHLFGHAVIFVAH